jgi:four helix bundle protein
MSSIFQVTRSLPREYQYSLADQLRRAGLSILNNIAEGSGKLSKKEKAQFYRTSLNSARECVPMLTVLAKERQISSEVHQEMRQAVIHVANMLGRLIASLN